MCEGSPCPGYENMRALLCKECREFEYFMFRAAVKNADRAEFTTAPDGTQMVSFPLFVMEDVQRALSTDFPPLYLSSAKGSAKRG